MTDEVAPIKPDVVVRGTAAQRLAEKMNRRFAEFEAEHGAPVAYALVLMDEEGLTVCSYQTEGFDGAKSPGRGGWRGFLALAGARLTAIALAD